MTISWTMVNELTSVFAALCFSVIVIHPGIQEGITVKAGLIVCIIALVVTATILAGDVDNREGLNRAGAVLRIGLSVICIGIVVRANTLGRARRRMRVGSSKDERRTRSIIRKITEPVRDVATLLGSDFTPLDDGAPHTTTTTQAKGKKP